MRQPLGRFSQLWGVALLCTALAGLFDQFYAASALVLCGGAFLFGYGMWLNRTDARGL